MLYPGVEDVLKKYQARAGCRGQRPARLLHGAGELCRDAGAATSRRSDKNASIRTSSPITSAANTFHTVFGDIKFGKDGEWEQSRILMVQFQGITGNDLDQFKDPAKTIILDPPALKSGNLVYPFGG